MLPAWLEYLHPPDEKNYSAIKYNPSKKATSTLLEGMRRVREREARRMWEQETGEERSGGRIPIRARD